MYKNETIATYYTSSFDPLLSVLWSPFDKNSLIVGAKDQTLRIWKVTDYPFKTETGMHFD